MGIKTQFFSFQSKPIEPEKPHKIKNVEDQWMEDMEDIDNVATNYFDNLFCASPCDQMEECLNAVSCKVTSELQ